MVEETDGDLMGDGVNIAARLEGIAAPGAICLSEQAYWQVKSRLDLAVSDLGSTRLKNIAEPVHVYSLEVGKTALAKATKPAVAMQRSIFVPLAAGIVALIVVVGGAWYFLGANRPTTVTSNAPAARADAAHLSIVVLPFRNLSGDPSQDYFADGITENLTTDLSRIRNSFVIARNTAFTFKGKNIDTKEISKELGVRYVLEGSVQRDQNQVRVNAQLIDGETGAHLWADRFEESITDLFKLQDQVVARLANTLGYELVKAEAQRGTHSTNPDAIDLTMRGWAAHWQPPTKESVTSARDYFERAIKLDPQNAEAMVGLAYARVRATYYGWSTATEDKLAAQLELLTKATAINPGYAFAYYVKSTSLWLAKEYPASLAAAETEVALDPNSAYGYSVIGRAEALLGRCEQSIAHTKQAFTLSPHDPAQFSRHGQDVLAALVVLMQRVVEARDHACAVLKRRMLGDLCDAFAVDPDLASVVEAVEIFTAGVRQGLRGSADGGLLGRNGWRHGVPPDLLRSFSVRTLWLINRNRLDKRAVHGLFTWGST